MDAGDPLQSEADVFLDELNASHGASAGCPLPPREAYPFLKNRLRAVRNENVRLRLELGLREAEIAALNRDLETVRASRAWRFAHWLHLTLSSFRFRRGAPADAGRARTKPGREP